MIEFSEDMKIFVYTGHVDMRKAMDGLAMLVVETLEKNPQDKALYLFCNKSRDKLKGLFWHENGFMLLYKRMERDKFTFPQDIHDSTIEIDNKLIKWLLKGFDFYKLKQHPELIYTDYF